MVSFTIQPDDHTYFFITCWLRGLQLFPPLIADLDNIIVFDGILAAESESLSVENKGRDVVQSLQL
jgi:hypothetical protein